MSERVPPLTGALREVRDVADRAAGAVLRLGWPKLAALIAGRVAQFDCNFETDTKLQAVLRRPDGKPYHSESIARSRRQLRDAKLITSERVFMGAKMPRAKFASARGTTLKTFNWRAVCEKNPLSRRQRRIARQQQAAVLRAAGELVPPAPRCATTSAAPDRARYSAPPTTARTPPPPADLAEAISAASAALERRGWERTADERTGPAPVRSSAVERPPPD